MTGNLYFTDSLPVMNSGTQGKAWSLLIQLGNNVKLKSDEFLSQIDTLKVKLEDEQEDTFHLWNLNKTPPP